MLDLRQYNCLGEALRAALDRWPDEVCLIEADRDRENARFTYRQFKETALPLARALQDAGFVKGSRGAIIMTNQSKWLISAYAIFFCGGVLVPIDYKLTPRRAVEAARAFEGRCAGRRISLWRAITKADGFASLAARVVLVTEAPAGVDLAGAKRWEEFRDSREPVFVARTRGDAACIVYSSGTGGRPKGCVLTHENYLEQCVALTSLYPFWPGVRYLSICRQITPSISWSDLSGRSSAARRWSICGRYGRNTFARRSRKYKITYMSLVPMVLKNLERGLRQRFEELSPARRKMLNSLIGINRALTRRRPNRVISRALLRQVHDAFGGELRAFFVGGAFTEPATLQFFYDLGILVGNGYGCTEAGTVISVNDFKPFRSDTVGKPLPGMEIRVVNPDAEGIGEVAVRSKTVMSHYLDDPEMTSETIVDGWLMTGDLGRVDASGHLQLFGRKKNMIVTEEGKNIYPEDIENVFEGLPVKEFCVFAENYLWPERTMVGEKLVLVLRAETGTRDRWRHDRESFRAKPAAGELQARQQVSDLGCGFPAHGFAESEANGACRADSQGR